MVVMESTANGFNWFKQFWDAASRGENDFVPVFFAWFENPDYRMAAIPGFEATDEELGLKARFGLDDGQLAWRRWAIANNCAGDAGLFRQEYPATADEAFLHSGSPVFDNEAVMRRREEVRGLRPALRGEFVFEVVYDEALSFIRLAGAVFAERENGYICVYEPPVKGRPYVIGGDTAGEGSDWFTAQVIDNTNGRQVAVLRHQFDEDVYTRQLYCLGMYYNGALVGVEANYTTYPISMLQQMGYPRQYVRKRTDTYTGKLTESYGFLTDMKTRPEIVAGLVKVVRESPGLICDYGTLGEMLTFAYNERRRPEALEGEHDDLVMALAIAHGIRGQQQTRPQGKKRAARAVWTRDMYEDYERATREERELLIAMWGQPRRGSGRGERNVENE